MCLGRASFLPLVALAACSTPVRPADPPDAASLPPSCVELLSTDLDFGEVFTTSNASAFMVNHTTRPITVELGPVPPPFSAAMVGSFEVGPDLQLPLRFGFAPFDGRLQVADVSFVGGAGCAPQTIHLHGLGRGSIEGPAVSEFDDLPVGQTTRRTVQLRNTARSALAVHVLTGRLPPGLELPTIDFTVPASGTFDLPIDFTPTGFGTLQAGLLLQPPAPFSDLTLEVFGSAGAPTATLESTTADAGLLPLVNNLNVASHIFRLFHVVNAGVSDLRVVSVEVIPGPGTAPSEARLEGGSGLRVPPGAFGGVQVRFDLSGQPGPRAWTVRIHTNDPAHDPLDLEVVGTAIDPELCFTAFDVTPRDQVLPGSLPRTGTFTLSNPNATTCFVETFALASCAPGWSLAPAEPQFFLDAGQSRVFAVTATDPGQCDLSFQTWGNNFLALSFFSP